MLDEQIANRFIGHRKEIQLFEHWLDTTDASEPWILFFHDALEEPSQKGGVGKTWLLHKCAFLARERQDIAVVTIDFFSVGDRNGAEITRRVASSLKEVFDTWSPDAFDEAFRKYRIANRENKNLTEPLATLYEALTNDLTLLKVQLNSAQKRLLIFFDTFEMVEQHPAIAALNPSQTFPDEYGFNSIGIVIAGRNAPDWKHQNWRGRKREVREVPIEPFALEEMVQFINDNWSENTVLLAESSEARELYIRTQGRPILVGLVTDVINHRIMRLPQLLSTSPLNFERYLVEQINNLANPINWIVLFMAHIYHRFNQEILEWLFQDGGVEHLVNHIDKRDLWRRLLTLSFVRHSESSDDVVLHDEMRRLVNKYNWPTQEQETELYRKDLSESIVKYYEHAIADEPSSRARQTLTVEMMYHKLFVDLNEGFAFFGQAFNKAIELWQNAYARALLQEVQLFSRDFSQEQSDTFMLGEADLLQREENDQAALDLYEKLERQADASWLTTRSARILFQKGVCHLQMSHLPEAIENFTQSMDLSVAQGNELRVGMILSRLGSIYRRQREMQRATEYFERSIAIHKKLNKRASYADALNALGTTYRMQGNLDEALRTCMAALRLRQESYEGGGSVTEIGVGLSFYEVGVIRFELGELERAHDFLTRAFEIFDRNGYKRGIAIVYYRFGQIDIETGKLETALQWLRKAYTTSLNINAETEISSLNKQGLIHALQNHTTEAISFYQRAIKRSEDVSDFYQQADSLISLASVFLSTGNHKKAVESIQEAETIASKNNFYYLIGMAENFQADVEYNAGDYEHAFQHLGLCCYAMALYSRVKYEQFVRKTTDQLLALQRSEFNRRWQELRDYWLTLNLKEEDSRMLNALDDVKTLLEM